MNIMLLEYYVTFINNFFNYRTDFFNNLVKINNKYLETLCKTDNDRQYLNYHNRLNKSISANIS